MWGVVFKPIRGIEFIVAEKLPCRAMEAIGAGFDRSVENGARGTTQLGAEVSGLDLEFLDGIQRRQNDKVGSVEEVHGVGVVVDAVQQVVVLGGAQAVGGEGARGGIAAGVGLRRLHAGAKLGKEGKVAPVKRQTVDGLRTDDLPDRGFFGLQQRRRGGDLNGLSRGAGLDLNVTSRCCAMVTVRFSWVVLANPLAVADTV